MRPVAHSRRPARTTRWSSPPLTPVAVATAALTVAVIAVAVAAGVINNAAAVAAGVTNSAAAVAARAFVGGVTQVPRNPLVRQPIDGRVGPVRLTPAVAAAAVERGRRVVTPGGGDHVCFRHRRRHRRPHRRRRGRRRFPRPQRAFSRRQPLGAAPSNHPCASIGHRERGGAGAGAAATTVYAGAVAASAADAAWCGYAAAAGATAGAPAPAVDAHVAVVDRAPQARPWEEVEAFEAAATAAAAAGRACPPPP